MWVCGDRKLRGGKVGEGGVLGWNLYCSWEVLEMLKL